MIMSHQDRIDALRCMKEQVELAKRRENQRIDRNIRFAKALQTGVEEEINIKGVQYYANI